MRVKICGITRPEDALVAVDAGTDAIGVVLCSDSPRSVSPRRAREIFAAAGPLVVRVAVTHTTREEDLWEILAAGPDAIQVSHPFAFPPDPKVRLLRMLRRGEPLREDCHAIVVDDSHGQGRPFDPAYARDLVARSRVPVILAGGLTPENVAGAIRSVRPYAVDVASGVELSPGIKDPALVRAFLRAVREASS
ncbi:MAG: phosphoribosylanthranilate isomerase [Methanomicrobiales archaeon]|nr:phosphoribosylanthranilate isomerase [Methanomicrobiales archaeon]